ncbi:hypothetical protein THASP1DRAFT_30391 [Thamnocephalis sphaerospora]|uniref:Uncharacterized protein n=1 Tax=Thamnocephalis sphaerospora TaxID=78915 RepID=A0A4P9XP73_9FUNG|nr:hypothetical protein THASP1DRAFT_30391 [Thamnocephalis sphaerospora]|eukprot:RKP07793.1 hypothetical protein THASP1DRAFT_30391 [Thamnocephalis sphaerospora]
MAGPDDRTRFGNGGGGGGGNNGGGGGSYKKGRNDFKRKNSYGRPHMGGGGGSGSSSSSSNWASSGNFENDSDHRGHRRPFQGSSQSPQSGSQHGSSHMHHRRNSSSSSHHPSEPDSGVSHTSANGFNGAEVARHLNKAWSAVIEKLHDNHLPAAEKPELYRTDEQPWSSKGPLGAWGQRRGAMSTGVDFYTELSQQRARLP